MPRFDEQHFLIKENRPRKDVYKGYESSMEEEDARKAFEEGPSLQDFKDNPISASMLGVGKITGMNNAIVGAINNRKEMAGYGTAQKYKNARRSVNRLGARILGEGK